MDIWVGKILGQTSPKDWVQVHDFTPFEPEQIQSRGRLVVAIAIHQDNHAEGVEIATQGHEVISRVHELYYGSTDKTPAEQLTATFVTIGQEYNTETDHVELAGVAIVGEMAYVATMGGGVWTKKNSLEGWIINPGEAPSSVETLTGQLSTGQVMILGNSGFWHSLPLGVVKASVENEEGQAVMETLGTVIHGEGKAQNGVGIVVKIAAPVAVSDEVSAPAIVRPKVSLLKRIQDKLPKAQKVVYLSQGDRDKTRKGVMYAGIGFIILILLLAGAWQMREHKLAVANSAQSVALDDLLSKFREAKALTSLNPARSRELLGQVQSGLAILPTGAIDKKDARWQEITTNLPTVLGAATGTRAVNLNEILDLGLVRQGMQGAIMRVSEDGLVVLDTVGDRLVLVDPVKKKGDVVGGVDALGKTQLLATYPGKAEVLSSKGVVECSIPTGSCKVVISPDAEWGQIVDMGMFGGNIYLLSHSGIWRHQVSETGFSAKQAWIGEGEDTSPIVQSTSMVIDGSVWVVGPGGAISKYTRGVKDNFALSDLDKPLGSRIVVYTDADSEKLYILDPENGRLVVTAKTGAYDSQYVADQFKSATSVVVDEKAGALYVLTGAKVWGSAL